MGIYKVNGVLVNASEEQLTNCCCPGCPQGCNPTTVVVSGYGWPYDGAYDVWGGAPPAMLDGWYLASGGASISCSGNTWTVNCWGHWYYEDWGPGDPNAGATRDFNETWTTQARRNVCPPTGFYNITVS